jgi:spore coat polysaccharide biosynthesis protein SpsF (cytidylyltransferase family)
LCTEITNRKLNQYERVANSFSKFFNQDELSEILDRKADLELI